MVQSMKKMTSDELKEVQYNILLYVKYICEKYAINYFIGYGTLLGAVRHGGFIPWDDDIDVILLREDYNKLVKVMANEEHEYYRFCNMENGERCHGPYAIMEDIRTAVFHERFDQRLLADEGVSIDIFPFDDMPEDPGAMKQIIRHQKIWKAFNNLRITVRFPEKDGDVKKIAKRIGKILARVIGTERIFKNIKKISEVPYPGSGKMVGDLMCDPDLRNCFRKEIFFESVDIMFEKDNFKAPKNYKEFLTHCYGDYMKLPPVEQRQPCHDYEYFWR